MRSFLILALSLVLLTNTAAQNGKAYVCVLKGLTASQRTNTAWRAICATILAVIWPATSGHNASAATLHPVSRAFSTAPSSGTRRLATTTQRSILSQTPPSATTTARSPIIGLLHA